MRQAHDLMVYEADPVIRTPLAAYLRECGYRVIEATTPDEAEEILAKVDAIDLLLMNSPTEGGFKIAQHARATRSDVEVLLMPSLRHITEAAGELCENGPAPKGSGHHQTLRNRIRMALAQRTRPSAA
jgi:DNA-binding response OmpR family regulator